MTHSPLPRLIWAAIILSALLFAVQGGEYGTNDLISQRARRQRLVHQIDSLRRDVDSLTALKKAILTDPVLQERIAREDFGMVRGDKELLYRFAPADSAGRP